MIPETITYEEATSRYKCDRQAIRKAILEGKIVAYKPGKSVLIDRKTGDALFLSTQQPCRPWLGRRRRGARR